MEDDSVLEGIDDSLRHFKALSEVIHSQYACLDHYHLETARPRWAHRRDVTVWGMSSRPNPNPPYHCKTNPSQGTRRTD
jgi:hypothetical protein